MVVGTKVRKLLQHIFKQITKATVGAYPIITEEFGEYYDVYDAIENIGVACFVAKRSI